MPRLTTKPVKMRYFKSALTGYRLVAGGRRLAAAIALQWKTVPASLYATLPADQRAAIESEENEVRLNYNDRERCRSLANEDAQKAREFLESQSQVTEKEEDEFIGEFAEKPSKGGRPKKPANKAAVAEAIGVSRQSLDKAEEHVDIANIYPLRSMLRNSPRSETPQPPSKRGCPTHSRE